MRIKPKTNRLLIMAANEKKVFKYKLPRKVKKAYILSYGRQSYRYLMLRQRIADYDPTKVIKALDAVNEITDRFKDIAIKSVLNLGESLAKLGDTIAKNIEQNLPNYTLKVEERSNGVDLTLIHADTN